MEDDLDRLDVSGHDDKFADPAVERFRRFVGAASVSGSDWGTLESEKMVEGKKKGCEGTRGRRSPPRGGLRR